LRQNKSIKCSTIQSLISYGFDSNESLIALDFDKDLPLMTDISCDQKLVIKEVLNQMKSNTDLNNNNNNIIERQLISDEIKSFVDKRNDLIIEQINQRISLLEGRFEESEILIKKYENEPTISERDVNKLMIDSKQLRNELFLLSKMIESINNKNERQLFIHKLVLISIQNYLLANSYQRPNTLGNSL